MFKVGVVHFILLVKPILIQSWLCINFLTRGVWNTVLVNYCVCCSDSTILYFILSFRCVVLISELKSSLLVSYFYVCFVIFVSLVLS
jgi:hypothetical protein